jgi:hypothetical protein
MWGIEPRHHGRRPWPTRQQRGIAAVEFALLAIVFFMLVFSMLEVTRAVYLFNTLQEITRRAAMDAANSAFDPASMEAVRRRAMFSDPNGNLILGFPVTPAHLKIDYLSVTGGAGGSTLGTQVVSALPSCPAENATNCLTDPYGASCIRLVQVRICQPTEGAECAAVPYQSVFPFIDLSMVTLPRATTIVPAQTLGNRPGTSACE